MGVIKKLKGGELVGWQQDPNIEVYPITHLGAVFNDLNVSLSDILDSMLHQIDSGSGGGSASTYPINYLWAYTTARTDAEALSKLNRNQEANVPTNFVGNTNFEIQDGYYIYMTTARSQGGVYLRWEDTSIWSIPVRMGSGYTTSYTGNDGEGYNYIYCRTSTSTPPTIPNSLTVERIESLNDGGISVNGSVSYATHDVWYDHPLGVDGTYLYEWIAISRGSDSAGWSAYTGPTLWSKFGVDGKDGDGIEYIFTVVAEDAPSPLFINKYNGRIGENSSAYLEVSIENCSSDAFYNLDDFIPSGWHDTPLVLSLSYNKLYVSIRKKHFTNLNEEYWGPFSLPVLWAKISSSAITMTLDNDAIILDDDTSDSSTKIVSCTGVHIWDGSKEITTDSNYYIEIIAEPINSVNTILAVNVVNGIQGNLVTVTDIDDLDYINNHGYNFDYPVSTYKTQLLGMMFCLSRINELSAMNEGSYAIGYTARIYNGSNRLELIAEITKALSVKVININDGISYVMLVTPNSLPASRADSSSPYTFTGVNQIEITAKACSSTDVTPCNIYNNNLGDGKLYVTVRAHNASGPTSIEYASYLSGNGSETIKYTLSDAGNNCLYYIVNLYYVSGSIAYLVETETIDIVKKGDNGASAYTMSMSNDNSIIDELTVEALSLAIATLNNMTVYEGTSDITSRCTFSTTSSSLPTGLSVYNDGREFSLVPNADIRDILDEGNYSYTVTAYIDSLPIAVKTHKFIVKNITADGTVFKLNITNDTWQYDGDTGKAITTRRSLVSVTSITNGESRLETFTMISSASAMVTTGLVVVYPSELSGLVDAYSPLISPHSVFSVNGWDLVLYYNNVVVDSEHIDCIKNGRSGKDGTGAYTMTIDNDSAILDDDTTNASDIRIVTTVTASLFYGNLNYTTNNNTRFYLGESSLPSLLVVKNSNNVTVSSQDTELPSNTIYLAPNGTISSIDTGNYMVLIYAKYNGSQVATKTFTFSVEDWSDGTVYKLNIENDSWSYTSDGELLSTTSSQLSVVSLTNGTPTLIYNFTLVSSNSNIPLSGFVVVYPYTLSVNNSTKKVTPSTYSSNGYDFVLYYNGYKVDAEHIDCVKNGKDGDGAYIITIDNDTATLDDNTIDAFAIQVATTVHATLFMGSTDITNSASFYIESYDLPAQLVIKDKNGAQVTVDSGFAIPSGIFYLAPTGGATSLTKGHYSVTVTAAYEGVGVAHKTFTFSITDLSPDGSFYTLNILNDTWTYNGDTGRLISTGNSLVTVNKITKGTIDDSQSFSITKNLTGSGLEVLIPNSLGYYLSSIVPASTYYVNGYNIRLYYDGKLCDSEHIDCIKNGATGPSATATLGLRGAVVRNRGEWKSGNITYCYNTDMEGNGPSENNTVYIDIVYYNGNYYQCVLHHPSTSSSAPGNTLYWTVALNFEFIATKVLVADAADVLVLSGGSVVVKDDLLTVVGGMTGGSTRSTNDVIIWAGGLDPNLSAFKVYEDGSFNFGNGLFIWEKAFSLGTTLQYVKSSTTSSGNVTIGSSWENWTSPLMSSTYTILYQKTNSSNVATTTNKILSSVTAGRALFEVNAEGNRSIELYASTAVNGILRVEVNDEFGAWGMLTTRGANSSSDIRLKENLVDFLLTLEQMANSPLFKFNFKGHQDLLQVGTSALYWEPIIPEAISKKYNDRDKTEYLGLNYANVAFAAVISLAKEVKLLKEEVKLLKSLLQKL